MSDRPGGDQPGGSEPGSSGRDRFARYRERLDAVGFKPSSVRGQNFLLDPTLHRWIADQAAPGPADLVVEIGVGLGFLTRELAARAGQVLAVEIEPRLLDIARAELAGVDNVEWLLGDALGGPGRALLPRIGERCAGATGRVLVVANLPYSVSGPLLAELAQLSRLPDGIVVLVQKELGQRLSAGVGHADYGGLGVLLQNLFEVRSLRDVSPEVFRPRPRSGRRWWSCVACSHSMRSSCRKRRGAAWPGSCGPCSPSDARCCARPLRRRRESWGWRRSPCRSRWAGCAPNSCRRRRCSGCGAT